LIEVEEMRELVRGYRNPCMLIIGSHSALDAWSGARSNGFRSIIYTTRERAVIYLHNAIAGGPDEFIEDGIPQCIYLSLRMLPLGMVVELMCIWVLVVSTLMLGIIGV